MKHARKLSERYSATWILTKKVHADSRSSPGFNPTRTGFTIVEIIFTIAIVSVLAAIVKPMYRNWIAKGVQTQAKQELSAIYLSERSFKEEYKTFHYHLPVMGFVPEGIRSADNYPPLPKGNRYYGVTVFAHGPLPTLADLGLAAPGGYAYIETVGFGANEHRCRALYPSASNAEDAWLAMSLPLPPNTSATTFTAVAMGCPLQWEDADSAHLDAWTIDEGQNLKQVRSQ